MKTRLKLLKWLIMLLLSAGSLGAWADSTLPQTVCPGPQDYWVIPGNSGNNFTWSISPGNSPADWTITPNGNPYTVIVDWKNVGALPVTYTITITETVPGPGGCSTTKTLSVTVNPKPAQPTVTLIQPTCTVTTGTITITAPTGIGMTYSMDGLDYSNTTGIFTLVPAGNYTVTAKNSYGCISAGTIVTINAQPPTPAAPTVTLTQPTCTVSTGTITVTAPTGTGMTYSIDGITYTNTTGIFTLLPAGPYTITAKNSDGCISAGTIVTINAQPPTPAAPTVTLIQPTCTISTGTITVTAPTGTGMTYSIDGITYINTTGIFTLLPAGTYTVTAKNSDGCISAGAIAVINPVLTAPAAPTVTLTHPTCTVSTGTITITAPTGIGMTYSIDGIDYTNTTGIFTLVPAGTYTVTAKNSDGCISAGTIVTIDAQPTTPAAPTVTLTHPTCTVSTGTITVTAPTGIGMTYSIDGITYTNTTGIFTLLPAGTYTVTAKNSYGCISAETIVTIDAQPPIPAAPTVTLIQPTCTVSTGTITVMAPTGTGMTYSINGTDYTNTTGIFTLVPAGTYTVTAKNLDGCISVGTIVTIDVQPASPNTSAIYHN